MTSHIFIAGLGAFGLGFVLGWTLYFANRGKSGNLSTSDLAAIAGVIAGGAIAAFIGNIGEDTDEKALVFGAYGIGLLAGFLQYFRYLRQASDPTTADPGLDTALRSLQKEGEAARLSAEPEAVFRPQRQNTPDCEAAMEDLRACLEALEAVILDLAVAADAETDPVKKAQIKQQLRNLEFMAMKLNTRIAICLLTSDEIQDFLAVVRRETDKLNVEARRMRDITQQIERVDALLGAANTLVDSLKRLAA